MNNEWELKKLEEIADFNNGRSIKVSNSGVYPVYGANGKIGFSDSYKYENGTIIGRVGAYCGSTAYEAGRFWASDNTIVATSIPEKSEPEFINYLLKDLNLNNFAQGAAQPLVTQSFIKNIEVRIPNLNIQQIIARIISSYDKLISNNNKRIKLLEEMAQTLYNEWFVNFRYPGHEKVKMVDSELGKIPEGWEIKNLQDCVSTQYGYTESTKNDNTGTQYLRGMDINKCSYIDWSHVPFCTINGSDFLKYKLNLYDVLLIRMANPGVPAIVEKDVSAVYASYLIKVKPMIDSITPYYLFYFLLSERYQNYIKGASTGSTRQSASASVLTTIKIIIPEPKYIQRFEETVKPIRKELNTLIEKNNVLTETRDLLIPKLISGELDVSELDI